jgi:hypothetical protein
VKKIVLAVLLAAAYQAAFADTAAGKDVTYEITFSRDSNVLQHEILKSTIGVPVVSKMSVQRPGTQCALKDASGAPLTVNIPLDDETTMTAIPSALKDGRVETIIEAHIVRAAAGTTAKSGDCTVATGQSRSISVIDFVPMHETDTRTYNMGDGTTMLLKLVKGGAPNGG